MDKEYRAKKDSKRLEAPFFGAPFFLERRHLCRHGFPKDSIREGREWTRSIARRRTLIVDLERFGAPNFNSACYLFETPINCDHRNCGIFRRHRFLFELTAIVSVRAHARLKSGDPILECLFEAIR